VREGLKTRALVNLFMVKMNSLAAHPTTHHKALAAILVILAYELSFDIVIIDHQFSGRHVNTGYPGILEYPHGYTCRW